MLAAAASRAKPARRGRYRAGSMRSAVGLLLLAAAAALVDGLALLRRQPQRQRGCSGSGSSPWRSGSACSPRGSPGCVPRRRCPRGWGWPRSGCSSAFVCWNGVTMIWSIAPDLSWAYLNRGAVYVAFALLGLARRRERAGAGAARRGRARGAALRRRRLGAARQGVPVAVPGRRAGRAAAEPDRLLERARAGVRDRAAARALGRDAALVAARAAGRRRAARLPRRDRARAHVLAGGDRRRRRRACCSGSCSCRRGSRASGRSCSSVVPAAAVAGWASTRAGPRRRRPVARGAPGGRRVVRARRRCSSAWSSSLAALWADGARPALRRTRQARRLWTRRIGLGVGALAVAGVIAVSAASGGPSAWLREFRGGGEVSNSARLGHAQLEQPLGVVEGGLAGLRGRSRPAGRARRRSSIARLRVRNGSIGHERAAQHRAAGAGGDGDRRVPARRWARCVAALVGDRGGPCGACASEERAAAVALAIAIPAYLLHALADIDWDFVAVSAPVFLARRAR